MGKRAPRDPAIRSWLIYSIRSTPAELVGIVDAPDEQTAIRKAIKFYKITDREEQKRLIAQRRD